VSNVLVEQREATVQQGPVVTVEQGPPVTGGCTMLTPEGDEISVPCGNGGGFVDEPFFVDQAPTAAPLLDLLMLPLVVRDLVFLGHVEEVHPMSGLSNGGLYALVLFAALLVVCFVVLLRRYDEVDR
jgi:hypothetical protein